MHDQNQSDDIDSFRQAVQDTAYFLWEDAGRPDDDPDRFWYQALDIHYRQRAYGRWMAELERRPIKGDAETRDNDNVVEGDDLDSDDVHALAMETERQRDA